MLFCVFNHFIMFVATVPINCVPRRTGQEATLDQSIQLHNCLYTLPLPSSYNLEITPMPRLRYACAVSHVILDRTSIK